jgi:cytochrome b pre-mRNA-processing protein 3
MGLLGFLRRPHERAGFELYAAAVAAARAPYYFEVLAVPDTLDGRFDLVGLFAALLIRRLRLEQGPGARVGRDLAQAVFDAMFADMDFNLRELGVGDLSVAKRMRDMWEAFHGRAMAYDTPLAEDDAPALATSLARNVWRGAAPEDAPGVLAIASLRQMHHLQTQALAALRAGRVDFLAAAQAVAV